MPGQPIEYTQRELKRLRKRVKALELSLGEVGESSIADQLADLATQLDNLDSRVSALEGA